jgi:hypothetical protein
VILQISGLEALVNRQLYCMVVSVGFLIILTAVFGCSEDDPVRPDNHAPIINSISADPETFVKNNSTTIVVEATDPDGDALEYLWDPRAEWLERVGGADNTLVLSNCCDIEQRDSTYIVSTVKDGYGGSDIDSVMIWILPYEP